MRPHAPVPSIPGAVLGVPGPGGQVLEQGGQGQVADSRSQEIQQLELAEILKQQELIL